jgi:hypothetical protein
LLPAQAESNITTAARRAIRISAHCTDEARSQIQTTDVWRPGRLGAMLG